MLTTTASPTETLDAALKRGAVEDVTDEGQVLLRLPGGMCEVMLIPLEQVVRVRAAALKGKRGEAA
jgi:hypothetical protein